MAGSWPGGRADGSVVLWDLAPVDALAAFPNGLGAKELDALWASLGDSTSTRGYQAVWTMAAAPQPTVAFLKGKLKPVAEPKPGQIGKLIDNLGHKQFAVRDQATKALLEWSSLAVPALRQARKEKRSEEVLRRLDTLLERLSTWPQTPADWQRMRAVWRWN